MQTEQFKIGPSPIFRAGELLCLSIRQPWAWLICNAGKDIENRNWPTRFRGRVLIHAGKTMTWGDFEACCLFLNDISSELTPDILRRLQATMNYEFFYYMLGGIVGEAEIVDCVTESSSPWFCGQYGFVLRNAKELPFEPCKGALGFFQRKK
jgi:hypothetical protein